jgi:hypothetical protein
VSLIKQIVKLFPMLPSTFLVVEDVFGRPQFRWVCGLRRCFEWPEHPSRDPAELRISFKSLSFVRLSIESLYGCRQDHRHDSCLNYPGFPMYLDLTSPTALDALYSTICFFIRCMDPLHTNTPFHCQYISRHLTNGKAVQAAFDLCVENTARALLKDLEISPSGRNEDIMLRWLDRAEVTPNCFCKTNYVAALRALRREVNKIAACMPDRELLDWPRVEYFGRHWNSNDADLLRLRDDQQHSSCAQKSCIHVPESSLH